MSRNNPASRFKISNPQPLQVPPSGSNRDTALPEFDFLGGAAGNDGRFPTLPPPSSAWPQGSSSGQSSSYMNGGREGNGPQRQRSPPRPARSRARERSERPELMIPDVRAAPVRQQSNGEIPPSPISPVAATQPEPVADHWAADRAQRTRARQQTVESEKAANIRAPTLPSGGGAGTGSDKLRNAAAAFMSASKQSKQEPAVRRPPRRRAQASETWDELIGPPTGRFAEIDAVMRHIKDEFPFIADGDFSPSALALSLLSSGQSNALPDHPDLRRFMDIHTDLSSSLQKAVQGHFQTFAASLPTHDNFVGALERAQAQVKTSREALKEAKEGLGGKGKAELRSVRARERTVKEMLQVLDLIEELKQVPEQLDSCIADKRFLQAALLLQRSLRTANREVLRDIGALADLRQYFTSQENTLSDILVEELHNHLYLKAFSSETRWKSYVPGQTDLPVIEPPTEHGLPKESSERQTSRFSRYLTTLAVKPNHEPILNEVASRSARTASQLKNTSSITSLASLAGPEPTGGEFDSFAYMEMLLEALAAMGKLGTALDTVIQRVPVEIHNLIEATTDEVAERAEQRNEEIAALARPQSLLLAEKRDLESMPLFVNDTLRVVVSLDASGPPKHAVILRDLFWTLYSKLSAVMEGHRAVYEVVKWISSRRDFRDTTKIDLNLNAPVLEIWKPLQQEVRTLLQTYLEDDAQGTALNQNSLPSVEEVLREGRLIRDKRRELFKFSDSDTRAVNNELKEVDEKLKQTLRASVPGLINLQAGDNVLRGDSTSQDRYASSEKHRTLIPANPFNVTILFQPTLSLIERATAIVPSGFEEEMTQFGTVLEEFVDDVFLPQLEEKVKASFQQAVSGHDAFQIDRRPTLAVDKPPMKSTVRVMALIQGLCAMLQETPFHRENYSRLIVGVVVEYYQQCNTRYKDLVTLPSPEGESAWALPATWSQRDDMAKVLKLVRMVAPQDRQETESVGHEEVKIEMKLLGDKPPPESQLINSHRKLKALANLARSIRWFMNALLDLQQLSEDGSAAAQHTREPGEKPRLPLTSAMAQRFEAIVQTYEQLVDMTLNTLHLEVRCRVLCNLSAGLQRGGFCLETEALEPDPDVVDLNGSLMEMDDLASQTLSDQDHDFMFRGLAMLIEHVFIHAARQIKSVNSNGVRKLRRNIVSLQQTLRGITHNDDGMLTRATDFWDLYDRGPKKMLESIRARKPLFSFEDYNAMLVLQCGGDDGALNSYLIDLHALAMSIEGWDVSG